MKNSITSKVICPCCNKSTNTLTIEGLCQSCEKEGYAGPDSIYFQEKDIEDLDLYLAQQEQWEMEY